MSVLRTFVPRLMATAAAGLVAGGGVATAQNVSSAQTLFESGQYEDSLRTINETRARTGQSADATYLAMQTLGRLDRSGDVRMELAGLAQFGPAWAAVADSARALLDGNLTEANAAADRAVMQAPDQFSVHYQRGLARMEAENWPQAAEAFERASQITPTFAYAHYYAGLAYSRIKRIDRTAEHFEFFLKLAPMAPERLAVESIMRTLRGR